MNQPRFAIINDIDQPYPPHVCEWIEGVGYCYMARSYRPDLKRYDGMKPKRPTPIDAFGFDVFVGDTVAIFRRARNSSATYEDGLWRRWQDDANEFSLPLVRGVKPRRRKQ